jgi:site-specific DNA recombinase
MKVAIYARVSTEEQAEEGYSIDAQLRECRKWAKNNEHTIAFEYIEEGRSGSTIKKRPQLQELLKDCHEHRFNIVLIHKLDRLNRNLRDALSVMATLEENDITLVSLNESFDFSTPIGRMVFKMMVGFAEFYLDNLKSEIRKGNVEKASQGKWPGHTPPFGYRYSKETSTLAIMPSEAEMIRFMYERYAQGNIGYFQLSQLMHERDPNKRFYKVCFVRDALCNRVYVGDVVLGETQNKKRKTIDKKYRIFEGIHAPIVSRELYSRVAEMRKRRFTGGRSVHESKKGYIFSAILHCKDCGNLLYASWNNRLQQPIYMCSSYYQGLPCDSLSRQISQQNMLEVFEAEIAELKIPTEWQQAIRLNEQAANQVDVYQNTRHRLMVKRKRLTQLYLSERLTEDEFWRQDKQVADEIAALPSAKITIEEIAHNAKIVISLPNIWAKATDSERKDLVRMIFNNIVVDVDKREIVKVTPTPSFEMLFRH